MLRARDLMTGGLITCPPETPVAEVAKLMRDRDVGDVLVADDGKLRGIVTDRDIAVRVAARERDLRETPVREYMSKHVITGEPHWKVDRLMKVMGERQIRRLPITDKGMLVGIVSMGDIALRDKHKSIIADSLKHVSEPRAIHRKHTASLGRGLAGLTLGLVGATVIIMILSSKSGASLVEQLRESQALDMFKDVAMEVRDRLSEYYA